LTGTATLIEPSREIKKTGEEVTIDGVRMVFQMTPGTEAPAEMNTYFPQFRAMWMAENSTQTLHNILTLRGAQVRDSLKWANFLNETIDLYGADTDVKFQSHHWPVWGNAKIIDYWKQQRDVYKYIHDQSVNLMNKGYTGVEISNMVKLPPELDKKWHTRGYYGTMKHNTRAVYQRYMGFYDANPTTLDQLPPEEAAKKYVEYMGGAAAVMQKAKADFDKGEFRWVAEAIKQVVLPIRTTRTRRNCWPMPTSRWAILFTVDRERRAQLRTEVSCDRGCQGHADQNHARPHSARRNQSRTSHYGRRLED
jgi:alkyl sulfatase BDS1-like metallo-beta-lactamase superfamily hydrolase